MLNINGAISHFGWADEVRSQMPFLPKKVGIRDVTFREGDDCVGCRVTVPQKLEMLQLAVEMGIQEIDVGGPSMHKHQYDFCKLVANSGIKVRKTARFFANNTKNYKKDVDICVEAGCDNLRIILMFLHEKTLLNQLAAFPEMVDYIHSQYGNMEVCFGMSDIPRAPMELIRKVYSECLAAGADKAGNLRHLRCGQFRHDALPQQHNQADASAGHEIHVPLPQHLWPGHGEHTGLR